jgi:hypothetical protein
MTNNSFNPEDFSISPDCHQTVDLLQSVFDGVLPSTAFEADSHLSSCIACRNRVDSAKLVLSALAKPAILTPVRESLTDDILDAVLADRNAERWLQIRRRVLIAAGGLTMAAGIFLAVWLGWFGGSHKNDARQDTARNNTQPENTEFNTTPDPSTASVQETVRIGEEFSKAEQAFLNSSRPITEPAAVAPQMLVKLTDVLTRPDEPVNELAPARKSLLELPEAARTGLQPVTSTAQKAFDRLIRDVGTVQTTAKPN